MPINKNEITKEMVEKALNVKDAKELMAYQRRSGSLFCGTFRH